jgi:hypothetical protein
MNLAYLKLAVYFWVRSVVFAGSVGHALEKSLLERRGAQAGFRVDGYLDALDVLLARIKQDTGKSLSELGFLEVGSGQTLLLPIMLRLLGARSVVSVDISDLTVLAIIKDLLHKLRASGRFMHMLPKENAPKFPAREVVDSFDSIDSLLGYFGVTYKSDCDLSKRDAFASGGFDGVDVVYSNNVLEHIPDFVLMAILKNCKQLLPDRAVNVHLIDLGDHFADAIPSLSPLNFLRHSNLVWRIIAGNRYIYQNRLRQGDYANIFGQVFGRVSLEVVEAVEPNGMAAFLPLVQPSFLSNTRKEELATLRLLVSAR